MIQLQEQQKKSPWLPIGSISLAVLTFAFTPILIRTCQEEIGPVSTIFNRYWIAAMILLLWNILKNPRQLLMKNQNLFSQMSQQKLCSICNKTVFLLLWNPRSQCSYENTRVLNSSQFIAHIPTFFNIYKTFIM